MRWECLDTGKEVEERLLEDRDANDRLPQTLTLGFSSAGAIRQLLSSRRFLCACRAPSCNFETWPRHLPASMLMDWAH